jgi:hypothetical protein
MKELPKLNRTKCHHEWTLAGVSIEQFVNQLLIRRRKGEVEVGATVSSISRNLKQVWR